jgi:hypothetical protein
VDADANLETEDDQTPGEGWEFELELEDGTIEQAVPVTDADGIAGWLVSFGPEGTSATVTEVIQENFQLLDASCVAIEGEAQIEGFAKSAIHGDGDVVGDLDGDSVSFPVENQTVYGCFFFNGPAPEESVGGGTGTPEITLPPTDTFGAPAAPSNDSWRIMLVVLAGILASVLILTPSPVTRRK